MFNTTIVLATIFKQNNLLKLKFYFSNVNIFRFSYFEPNFIEKFLWESVFFKFWSRDHFRETEISILAAILKR